MSHYADTSQLCDLASDLDIEITADCIAEIENVMEKLAKAVAEKLGVEFNGVDVDREEFGGICAAFGPAEDGQKCPERLLQCDPSSDWAIGE